jgi:hypothetical protein
MRAFSASVSLANGLTAFLCAKLVKSKSA